MITLNNINLSSIDLSGIDLRGIKLGLGGRGGGSGDGFPQLPGDVTRWHFGGLTNEMMAAMDDPRIEDADGKGRFLSFKNFLWAGMSGVGGYADNFSSESWKKPSDRSDITWTSSSFNITRVMNTGVQMYYQAAWEESESVIPEKRIIVKGLEDGQVLRYMNVGNRIIEISQDGIYTIPSFIFKGVSSYHGYSLAKKQESCDITIEQLPLYPGFILGDGVDDFAVTEKELNFEDTYTVYTAFIPFQDDPARNMILCGKNETKDFSINYSGTHINFQPSKGVNLVPRINQFMLLVCKRNKDITTIINLFTGESRSLSSKEFIANPGLYYLWRNVYATFLGRAAIAGQTICNGYFSTDEDDEKVLNYYKQEYPWLFPDQVWTVTGKTNEDEDRATIANITGNGNDLILSNFGFAGNSGYGDYPISFPSSLSEGQPYGTLRFKTDGKYSNLIKTGVTDIRIKFNLRGMPEGGVLSIRGLDPTTALPITEKSYTVDGLYEFVYNDSAKPVNIVFYNGTLLTGLFDFYVDIIPEYEGYLVTDGVDDKVESSPFTLNKDWTIVGNWTMLSNIPSNCGIIKVSSMLLYNSLDGVTIYFAGGPIKIQSKSINAFCSDGRIYFNDWTEILKPDAQIASGGSKSSLNIASYSANFTKMAFKNLAIYDGKNLSKDDCIKAYNYLQTLKAK